MRRRPSIRYALIVIAAAVLSAALLVSCGSTDDQPGSNALQAPPAPDAQAAGNSDSSQNLGRAADSVGAGAIGSNPSSASLIDRKITRTATLELSVEDVGAAVQKVDTIATTAGGYLSGSSVFVDQQSPDSGASRRTQTATVTVRVPADAFSSVMSQLRGIAKEVQSETSQASEVTAEYTDLQARLRNLQATEQRYLELMGRAEAIPDILTVQERLNSVRLEIEQVQGRINVLNDLTNLATITVQLTPPAAVVQEANRGWAEEAWQTSWDASQDTAVVLGTVAIAGSVLMAWLTVPLILVLISWRLFGRRVVGWAQRVYRL